MSRDALITDKYREQQAVLHAGGNYGVSAMLHAELIGKYLQRLQPGSLLDYGCGSKRSLLQGLDLPPDVVYEGYDPCVPAYAAAPCPAELVVCIDVLEHIEPDLLENVLAHLAELCDPYGLFTIHTGPANKVLPDGRNAHLIQQGLPWWQSLISAKFHVLETGPSLGGFFTFVRSRAN